MARQRTDAFGNPLPGPGEVDLWPDGPLGFCNRNRQRGRGVPLGGFDAEGNPNKLTEILLHTGGEGTVGDSMAGLTAITLGYEDGNDQNRVTPQYVRATIEWGTDGVQHQAICDLIRGTVIHVSGSFFRVIAEVTAREPEQGEAASIPAESTAIVQASIGYWGGGNARPQLTLQAVAQDFGEGVVARYRIPRFATEFTSISSGNPQANWKLAEGLGGSLGVVSYDATQRVPIPGPAQYLEVAGAGPGNAITTVFYLSI